MAKSTIYKDLSTRAMFSDPTLVADVINTVYFNGEDYIDPKFLFDGTTDLCLYDSSGMDLKLLKREADVVKVYSKPQTKTIVVLCIENQTAYDRTMPKRFDEYNRLIKQNIHQISEDINHEHIIFLNLVITYSGTRQKLASTLETSDYIRKAIKDGTDASFIREFRPRQTPLKFKTALDVFFHCLYLDGKKDKEKRDNYVKMHKNEIENNCHIAFFLEKLTGLGFDINTNNIGREVGYMRVVDKLVKEGEAIGEEKGIIKERKRLVDIYISDGFSDDEIAKTLRLSLDEIKKLK